MADDAPKLNPTALPLADAARLLSAVAAGAPTNDDGTLNVAHYAAWLVKEMAARAD